MPQAEWTVADAKSKLSEVLNRAEHEAQIITRRNRQFVVLDGDEYRRLTWSLPSLKEIILRGSNLAGVDLRRDPSAIHPRAGSWSCENIGGHLRSFGSAAQARKPAGPREV